MLARILLLLSAAVPLCAQQDEVSRYLEETRARVSDSRVYREAQAKIISVLTAQAEQAPDSEARARLYLRVSGIEQSLGNADAALEAARRAHELRPLDREVSLGLANALLQAGKSEAVVGLLGVESTDGSALIHRAQELSAGYPVVAAYCATLAHQLLPEDASITDDLGMILMWEGDNGSAGGAFRQAIAQAPLVSTYRYHLALAELQNRRNDDAKAELLTALELNPLDDERAAIRAALARLEPHK